jgi:hypothetical protein
VENVRGASWKQTEAQGDQPTDRDLGADARGGDGSRCDPAAQFGDSVGVITPAHPVFVVLGRAAKNAADDLNGEDSLAQ